MVAGTESFTSTNGSGSLFTRTGLSNTWSQLTGSDSVTVNSSNQLTMAGIAGTDNISCGTALTNADHYAELELVSMPASSAFFGVSARQSGSSGTYTAYSFEVSRGITGNGTWRLVKTVNNSRTTITSATFSSAFGGTGVIRIEVVGTQIRCFLAGTQYVNTSDSSITTGNKTGIIGINGNNAILGDNFAFGDLSGDISLDGAIADTDLAAPAGTAGTGAGRSGPVAGIALVALAGTYVTNAALAGPVANIGLVAPAGTRAASGLFAGPVAGVALAAVAGSVGTGADRAGPVAAIAASAPSGTVSVIRNINLAGVTADIALVARAGTQSTTVTAAGPTAAITLAALAGGLSGVGFAAPGVPAAVTLAAPAGAVTTVRFITVAGVPAALSLVAVPGAVSTPTDRAGPTASLTLAALPGDTRIDSTVDGVLAGLVLAAQAGAAVAQVNGYQFTPPARKYGPAARPSRLWAYFGLWHGQSLVQDADGSWRLIETVTTDDEASALKIYMGGHVYFVGLDEAALLADLGYADCLFPPYQE